MSEFKTQPRPYQLVDYQRSRDMPAFGLFWEMGTGKTKLVIDTAAHLYRAGEIDTVVVVAPASVHSAWVLDELPRHLPEDVAERGRAEFFRSSRKATQWHRRLMHDLHQHDEGLVWLTISYDAFMTKVGKQTVWDFLRDRRCLYVLDESSRIKTPNAKRTKSIVRSSVHAPYRRILNGTPVDNSPFDLYTQVKFLDPKFWKRQGIGNAQAFRHHFGVIRSWEDERGRKRDILVDYQNLEVLKEWIEPITSRVRKVDVLTDLPPKQYSLRHFELSPGQRRVYDEIRDEFLTELEDGEVVAVPLLIVRLLRLQQIACGYLPTGDEDKIIRFSSNPRLDLQVDLCEDVPHQAIIWCRFTEDVDQLMRALGKRAARFDGKCSEDERESARQAFKSGDAQFFVAKPSVGGEGLTLTEAKTEFYYSNSFSLRQRLQSEDRAHRIGQDQPLNIVDLIADDTIDRHLLQSFQRKLDVASQITGDEVRTWL